MQYFAYGSNMLTRRLVERVGSAVACGTAVAPGFVVRFHKISRKDGSGKCTLVEAADPGAAAHGVLYEVAEGDMDELDRVEGKGYVRRSIAVRLAADRTVEAMTYVAGAGHVDPALQPFDWYRDLCAKGAVEHGLPAEYVAELERTPATPDPDSDRAARMRQLLDD